MVNLPHTELVAVGIEEGPQQRAHWWYRVLVVLMEDLQNSALLSNIVRQWGEVSGHGRY